MTLLATLVALAHAAPTVPVRTVPSPTPAAAASSEDVALARMRDAVSRADWDEAARLATAFPAAFPASPNLREAAYTARRAAARVVPDMRKLLVLLPLTGEMAVPAGRLRDAIRMAAEPGLSVEVVDTHGDPAACVAALESGVLDGGASLVLGPLRKEEAATCAPAAQALRVPMITLTSSAEGLAAGDHVFRGYPSVEQQIAALLDAAMQVHGLRRFAVVHPQTAYGESAATLFESAVRARGGEIAIRLGYASGQKDYLAVARQLGRKDFQGRASELRAIKKAITKEGGNAEKATLPPVVDYEGLFVPDGYQPTALLAAALAFEEFPIGAFVPRRGERPVRLLGLAAWNNEDFVRRGAAYVRDSMFVDAFLASSADPTVLDFVDAWRARGVGEPTMMDAVGYDLGRLARVVADGGGGLAGLRAARLLASVSGLEGFGEDRQALRHYRVLTIGETGVALLPPPGAVEPETGSPP
ncbi:MAG: hypothetical protein RLZZ299_2851 [Pseudomonadota bacterium]|jgi:branched-chain amino acid transport system substrate-binding protein